MTTTKVLDRIRKVLAKAEGTNNPAEAAAMMEKVEAMLAEHNLTLLDVAANDSTDPMGTDKRATYCWVSNSWIKPLAGRLARLYGCRIVTAQHKNKIYISISGRESARVTWQLMLPFVIDQVKREARNLREGDIYTGLSVKGVGSYERAVGNALTDRIGRMVMENERRDADRVAGGERALVPVDMLQAEIERAWGGGLITSKGRGISTTRAARTAAGNVSLHRQTSGSTVRKIGN